MNKISENIKKMRLEKDLTQQDVADQLFVTRQCISRWEQGITLPDISSIEKLTKVFNCSINDIIDNDSIKTITINEAIKNKKTKKVIATSILVSFLAILISLVSIYVISKSNDNDYKDVKHLRAIVLDKDEEVINFKLDAEQIRDEEKRDFTLIYLDSINVKVYDEYQKQIGLSQLKSKDIIQLSYFGDFNIKNISEIKLISSEVEKNFYGVIVLSNGERYEKYEDIPTDGTKGIRYFLYEEGFGSTKSRHNAGLFETKTNFTFEDYNGTIINRKYEFEMNIYFDS